MTTQTLTLTDFLLARIAEDEALGEYIRSQSDAGVHVVADAEGRMTAYNSARVLAECATKRFLIEYVTALVTCGEHGEERRLTICRDCVTASAVSGYDRQVLARLALPYADHPDYREEWRA